MADRTFAYLYATDSSGVVLDSAVLQEATVTSPDATISLGDFATVTVPSIGIDESLPYVGRFGSDMFFSIGGAERWLLSNNEYLPGEPIPIDSEPYVLCFLEGTVIATPAGSANIETLKVGDLVLTSTGEARPVRWIGRQTVQRVFADPLRSFPICIAAGALGDNMPVRNLYVSPDHALLLDGLLVQAGALVNGTTVVRVERPEERFTYYHIELADHALILAEGVPAETFVDNVTRRRFDNYAEFDALYGERDATLPELDLPRVKSARQLPAALRARLAARAGKIGAAA